ncbi:MAG: HWE histidine kinase domain-containing protein [Xanthobacteraceae bacterium]
MLARSALHRLRSRPRTIRFHIVSLVAIILIPLISIIALLAISLAEAKRSRIESELVSMADQVTTMADREITKKIGMLIGLTAAGNLASGDIRDFHKHTATLASESRINRMWAFDKEGTIVSSGAMSDGESGGTDPELLTRVFGGETVVSEVHGEGLRSATVVIAVPVVGNGQVTFGVAAEIPIDYLSLLFAAAGLREDWAAAIVDRNGRYVARSLDAERRVGQAARPELGEAARRVSDTGMFENVTYEGVSVLNAFRRSPLTGWTTVVAVPKANLNAPLRRYVAYASLGIAGILFLTLSLASAQAARIAEPVRNLSRGAVALVEGHKFPEAKHRIYELDEVRAAFERAIAESAHLSALVASSGDAIMSVGLNGMIKTWNAGAEALFGYSAKEVIGEPETILIPQDEREAFHKQRAEVLLGHSIKTESVRLRQDNSRVDVSLNLAPICGPGGEIAAVSSIIHDISGRKAVEQRLKFLMRELSHRSKNQLAIIQAIATQLARSAETVDDFMSRFRTRLQGLSASHDLLVSRNWTGVLLEELVRRQLEPFADTARDNVEITGPQLQLTVSTAEAIGLALHELATNSAKYGALSVPSGRLKVAWSLEPAAGELPCVRLEWCETGGPAVRVPERKGFGSLVIERMVASAISGKVRLEFAPAGVYWRLAFPSENLVDIDEHRNMAPAATAPASAAIL